MNKSYSLKQLISVTSFSVASAVLITIMVFQMTIFSAENLKTEVSNAKLNEILELVDKYYVGDVDEKEMADNIAAGTLAGLGDKYASYVTSEDSESRFDSLFGYNTGIGVQISVHPDNGTMVVLELHEDGPAKVAGVKPFDEITAVDDVVVTEAGYTTALQYIKTREIGTVINIKINRAGKMLEIPVELKQHNTQSVFYRLIDSKGYIQITSFNEKTVEQFKTAIDTMIEAGAEALVFDLRGNGGGTVTSVCAMLDYILPEGLVLKVDYKDKNYNEVYMSDKSEIDIPMAVLTDGNTASASELFTQSLRDYGKAIVVGRKTYGKGVVQRTFTLSDGSLAVFTVARYYTKSGYCPEENGIVPDVEISWTEEELKYRLINGIEKDKEFIAALEQLDSAGQPS